MTKSRFKIVHLLWNSLMLICSVGIFYLLILVLKDLLNSEVGLGWSFLALFLTIILLVVFLSIKNIKYIKIDSEKNHLVWYSIINPFGTQIKLGDLLGYITMDFYSANGKTKKIFLVDNKRKTGIGIDELVYTNFEELKDSLNLKEVRFRKGGVSNYIKLLYLDGIKI
ncbi:hypothetical protein [Ulvibacterium marinum]|uniref:hypothetical protein n=1 Tax=Ulvibacterium marinum TaxID=2419782 RepID=UPI00249439C9|nr:hypothetical protein [Ulvibacterium marinum]